MKSSSIGFKSKVVITIAHQRFMCGCIHVWPRPSQRQNIPMMF